MAVRVFAWRVEFMRVMGVLDRADAQAARRQILDQLDDKRRLPVVLPPQ
jgi:hypothetical protein